MQEPLFILQGNGRVRNRGCEAILRSTVAILQKEFGPCRFINAPSTGRSPRSAYETPDLPVTLVLAKRMARWTPSWLAFQFRKRVLHRHTAAFEPYLPAACATLALGGDNYSLDYGLPTRYFEANQVTLWHGKPLVLWGASVGPFDKDPEFERYAAEQLKRVTLICARESETIAYLDSLGVRENVRAVSDPAFVLEPMPGELTEAEAAMLSRPCLGLNFSPLLGRYWKPEVPLLDCLADCVKAVLKTCDLPILLVPHVVYEGNDDHAFLALIAERLAVHRDRLLVLGKGYNAQQLKWIIGQLTAFAGARTHATIAALSSGVPTLSIGYSMKARGLNKDIFGHLDWMVPLDALDPDRFGDGVGRLLKSAPAVRQHLARVMPAYRERAWQAARFVHDVLPPRMVR